MSAITPCSSSRARASTRSSTSCGGSATGPDPRPRPGRPSRAVAPARREQLRRGIEDPTLGEGVEVSAALRFILTGRFDPGGRGPEPVGASPSMRAGALDRKPRGGRPRPRVPQHATHDGRMPGRSARTGRPSSSAPPVVELGDLARGDSALVGRVGSPRVLPQRGADRPAGRRRPGLCPRARDRPPRHQAVEPAAGHRGRRLDHRLRPGQGRRRRADAHRRHPGHPPLHGPRAVPRRRGCPGRRLRAGPDALRAARRCARHSTRPTGSS